MRFRWIALVLFLTLEGQAAAAHSQFATSPAPASFEQKLGQIMADGGSIDAVRSRLNRLSREAGSADQRISVEAFQLMVRGLEREKGPSLAEAESFALRHPNSAAALVAVGNAALNERALLRSADAYTDALTRMPSLVDAVPADDIDNLVGALVSRFDSRRLSTLGRALFNAGWNRGSPPARSYLATQLMLDELGASRADRALQFLPSVTDPQLLYSMLADKRFEPIRPEIEQRWGSRLEQRWREYLAGFRDEWMRTGKRDAAFAYAHALQQANYHQSVVDQFLPRFTRGYNCWNDPVARGLVGILVNSLYELGRASKAQDVMGRVGSVGGGGVWSGPSIGSLLLMKGDFDHAAKVFELSLVQAAKRPNYFWPETVALTRARLACANHRRGKNDTLPATDLLSLSSRIWLELCMGNEAGARSLILSALENEDQRLAAIQWVQPSADSPNPSEFARAMEMSVRALQRDPAVLAAIARHGIVHIWTLASSAPPELEFKGLPVRRASPCSGGYVADPMDAAKQPESLVEQKPRF